MSDSICVFHHLGLGDHIVCNGLVRTLVDRFDPQRVLVPCWAHNRAAVSAMFSDEPRIEVIPISELDDVDRLVADRRCSDVLAIYHQEKDLSSWDQALYARANVPFEHRWSRCRINRNPARENALESNFSDLSKPFALDCRTYSCASFLHKLRTSLPVIRLSAVTDNLLDWCGMFERADEVHCIDSAPLHLAQCLSLKRAFFHNVRREKSRGFFLASCWEEVFHETAERRP